MATDQKAQFFSFITALLFTVFNIFVEEWALSTPQGYRILTSLAHGPSAAVPVLFTTLVSFGLLFSFAWLVLSLRRGWRIPLVLAFAVPAFVAYNYWKLFHRPFSFVDLDTALNAPVQVYDAAARLYFNRLALVPLAGCLALVLLPGHPQPRRARGLALAMLGCLLVNLGFSALRLPVNWGTAEPGVYRTVINYARAGASTRYIRQAVPYQGRSQPRNNLVLVIDESIRSDHLSLNGYDRPTTPTLERLAGEPGLLHNWGTAVAGATCSTLSNALLLTGVPVTLDSGGSIQATTAGMPTLFHYAKAAGYLTTYMDDQADFLWNSLAAADLGVIDEWRKVPPGHPLDADLQAAEWIRERVTSSQANFIVLNKAGVHFLYENSYPPEEALWGPIPEDYHRQPELAVNPYDNGIRYAVDAFFSRLLPNPAAGLENTILLYTSDHGQTLFEGGVGWLHCNFTPQEASVPLFLLGSLPAEPDTSYAASHANILPTLLDLMGLGPEARLPGYAPSLLSATAADSAARYYIAGDGAVIEYVPWK